MTTAAENELLTRVGPGTPMGEVMRQYWMPVARSSEVEADGPPLRLMLLGEKLIAFRDTSGRVGVMDHRCPHRCASLFFGRNEEDGIRCVYHGWKYDVEGNCLDMANLPPHQQFKDKVRAKAYRVTERFGAIWVYMGARAEPPPFPDFELNEVDEDEIDVRMIQQQCNWLQGLENDLDTSHFGFLHLGGVDADTLPATHPFRYLASNRTPEFHIEETPAGLMYGAHRPAEAGTTYWRLAQFMVPFWVVPPAAPLKDLIAVKAYIPMDDTHTMTIMISRRLALGAGGDGELAPGLGVGRNRSITYQKNTTDWLGRWRLVNTADNDYLIDREAQRQGIYTGITGIQVQDTAIAETMGPITDRSFERLAPSDEMIALARRKLIGVVRGFQKDTSMRLPGVDDPEIYRGHRAGDFHAPADKPFREAYADLIREYSGTQPRWAAK